MSGRVIFLLEEPSMKAFLTELLPRLVPGWREGEHFQLVPHEGKSDLDRSIPIKLKAWREPGVRFVIVRDNDGADCGAVKARLLRLCAGTGREAVVRLICQELEGWYLGDEQALLDAYPDRDKVIRKLVKRFADPDGCLKPSAELEREMPGSTSRTPPDAWAGAWSRRAAGRRAAGCLRARCGSWRRSDRRTITMP